MSRSPWRLIGVFEGTAQNVGSAIRARKSGAGARRRMISLFPFAITPEMRVALPAMYASAPSMSPRNRANGLWVPGFRVRAIVYLNVCAVTGSFEGGEKRKPRRIVNVYVLPSAERVGSASATSGVSWAPPAPGWSG